MSRKQQIILAHLGGESARSIASRLHLNRRTVRKYIEEYDEARQKLLAEGGVKDPDELIGQLMEKPKYHVSRRSATKATPEVVELVEECLKDNEDKRARGLGKQQMKKTDICEYVQSKGYQVSYDTIKRVARQLETRHAEAYIRQEYVPGNVCEFDWGTVKLVVNGEQKEYQMAVFTAAYSNYRYAVLFRNQDTAAFQESHVLFSQHCHGSFHTMVYDNMKVAVKAFVGSSEKEPTQALLQLSTYYGFQFRFCNIRRGNEKGHVERSVEYVRRKVFSAPGQDNFGTLEEANTFLLQGCAELNGRENTRNRSPAAMFEEERACLLPAMPRFERSVQSIHKVDKYSTITVDGSHYSVPDTLVGKRVQVRLYTGKVLIYHDGNIAACHNRNFDAQSWNLQIEHYVKTLRRKPGALAGSTALLQSDAAVKEIFERYYRDAPRDFLDVLEIIKENGIADVQTALRELSVISPTDLNGEKVRQFCKNMHQPVAGQRQELDPIAVKSQTSLSQYDRLRELQAEGGGAV